MHCAAAICEWLGAQGPNAPRLHVRWNSMRLTEDSHSLTRVIRLRGWRGLSMADEARIIDFYQRTPMDPLSITASAIAVLGAFRQAVKSAERLRAVRRAPEELKLLLKEVTDLSELLKDAQLAQRPPAYEETDAFATPIPNPSPTSLDWHISRTSTVLQDLDSLVEDHASRTDRRRLDHGHWGWHQGRRKANALREELKVLRLNLAASLGANTS